MMAPATSGPTMREPLLAMPLRASPCGSSGRGSTSGKMAAKTGQRMAMPMPLAKVSSSSSGAVITSSSTAAQMTEAMPATQNWVSIRKRRRSTMSASAPLGRASRNTGRAEAACTRATHSGVGASDVISHAAATSFIHMLVLAVNQTSHSIRYTGSRKGPSGDFGSIGGVGGGGLNRGSCRRTGEGR